MLPERLTDKANFDANLVFIDRHDGRAILKYLPASANTLDDGVYEFVLISNGSTSKIIHKK